MSHHEIFDFKEEEGVRADAVDKVTGRAKYAAEHPLPNMAYAVFVTAKIAKGSITALDDTAALQSAGVLDVISFKNCPDIPGYKTVNADGKNNLQQWRGLKVLSDDKVRFYGQPIALIVADSFENANAAIPLIKVNYQAEAFETDFHAARKDASKCKQIGVYHRGNMDALKTASTKIEAEYNIPIEVHNPMEMHASIAVWEGDHTLTVYDKTQGPKSTQMAIARLFGLEDKNVRVIADFVGGAFGSALRSWMNLPAACIAAKKVKQPVKLVLTRPQMFTLVGYRPQSWQKISIAADASGKLTGISHEAISNSSRYEDFREGIVDASRFLYACDNVQTDYKILPLDLSTPTWMRGPGEATGCFALESAIDELAHRLKIDPIELRIINHADINPESKLPWSSKNLKDCLNTGKEKIGWKKRAKIPGTLKEDGMLVGYGMATGVFGAGKGAASVKIILQQDGHLLLQSAVSDMGAGTTTAMTKIAADNLAMPLGKIKFKLGDSDLPPGPTQGGSTTTSTLGSAVQLICETLKQRLKDLAIQYGELFKGMNAKDLMVKNECVFSMADEHKKISIPELMRLANQPSIEIVKDSPANNPQEIKYAINSFSAHFVKVHVHPKTFEIRIKEVITTGDAGKIISENTARSQMLGGVVGGIGMALKEEITINHQTGEINNANLASYHVPLHTDIPPIDVWFSNKPDPIVNAIGAKGLGEIAFIGFAAAVANAVFNATGKRVRDLPITPEKLKAIKS